MTETHQGASNNERLLAAARSDNEELLLEVFEQPESFDINFKDGLGNTALHYAAQHGATLVIEHILSYDGCDVDLQNRMEHDTPLHSGLKGLEEPELRNHIICSLLDAGANTKIKDRNGDLPVDLVSSDSDSLDTELRAAIRRAEAEASIPQGDIAHDDDIDDGGSDSGTDDD